MSPADARPAAPGPDWQTRRIQPGHAPVWVRIAGAWRKGRITEWVQYTGGSLGWEVVIEAEGKQDLPWQGRYIYDAPAIRPRHDDTPSRGPLDLTRQYSRVPRPGETSRIPGRGSRMGARILPPCQLVTPGLAAWCPSQGRHVFDAAAVNIARSITSASGCACRNLSTGRFT